MHAYDSSSPAFVNNLYRSGTSYTSNQQSYGFKAQEYPVALRFDSQPMAGVPYSPSSFSAFYPCAPTAHRYLHQFNCSYPSSISNGFIACRRPKRIRTAFTPTQLLHLESAFDKNHYIVGSERKQLASFLNLSETQIKVWFQNRRTKWKRQQVEDNRDLQLSPLNQGQVKSEQEQLLQRFSSSPVEQQSHEKSTPQ